LTEDFDLDGIDKMIKEVDKDNDGKIQFEEFKNMMMKTCSEKFE